MDIREKLIDLLTGHSIDTQQDVEYVADHLIANGVTVHENVKMSDELLKQLKNAPITLCKSEPSIETVQEWIPVEDRLPEYSNDGFADAVLVTDGFVQHMAYFVGGEWRFAESGEIKEPMWYRITHWMPMPLVESTGLICHSRRKENDYGTAL